MAGLCRLTTTMPFDYLKLGNDELQSNPLFRPCQMSSLQAEAIVLTDGESGKRACIGSRWIASGRHLSSSSRNTVEKGKLYSPTPDSGGKLMNFNSTKKSLQKRLRRGLNWVILHKDFADRLDLATFDELQRNYMAAFANEVFVVFTNKALPAVESNFDPAHVEALWVTVKVRKSSRANQEGNLHSSNRFWLHFTKVECHLNLSPVWNERHREGVLRQFDLQR